MSVKKELNCTLEPMWALEKTIPFSPKLTGLSPSSVLGKNERRLVFTLHRRNMKLSGNNYFSHSPQQAQIIILGILYVWMRVPLYLSGGGIIFAVLDFKNNISFSASRIGISPSHVIYRIRYELEIVVVQTQTGIIIDTYTLLGSLPGNCPRDVKSSDPRIQRIYGSHISFNQVMDLLDGIVNP